MGGDEIHVLLILVSCFFVEFVGFYLVEILIWDVVREVRVFCFSVRD